jgi:hypothetical protein
MSKEDIDAWNALAAGSESGSVSLTQRGIVFPDGTELWAALGSETVYINEDWASNQGSNSRGCTVYLVHEEPGSESPQSANTVRIAQLLARWRSYARVRLHLPEAVVDAAGMYLLEREVVLLVGSSRMVTA